MKKKIIIKYLNRELSPKQIEEVELFLQSEDGESELNALMDEYWMDETLVLHRPLLASTESILHKHLKFTQKEEKVRTKSQRGSFIIAASIILVVLTGIQYYLSGLEAIENDRPIESITKSTSKGLKSTVQLKDGTKVMLNSESSIRYPKYFSDSARVVYLEGEAFFDVFKDKTRPFIVLSQGVSTTALGTSFNINSYIGSCKVSLATGKVEVHHTQVPESYFLKPGQSLHFELKAGKVTKSIDKNEDDFLWTKGIIAFDNNSFDEVIQKLGRWYNVDFQIENKSNVKKYTGQFENRSLETILENMSFTLDFNYFIHEKQVKIIFED